MISYGSFSFAEFAIIMMSFTIFKKSWKPTLLLQKDYSFHIWLEKIVHRLNFFKKNSAWFNNFSNISTAVFIILVWLVLPEK